MEEKFDSFPVNMFETGGTIKRKDFYFFCADYRIWYDGKILQQGKGRFEVNGIVSNDGTLNVTINSDLLDQYTFQKFNLKDISLSGNRILWSDFSKNADTNEPTALSLFYKQSVLSRVSITISIPQLLIEMDGYPSKSPGKKEEDINIQLAKEAFICLKNNDPLNAKRALDQLFVNVKNDPSYLSRTKDYSSIGLGFLQIALSYKENLEYVELQKMSSGIAYFCLSKAIEEDPMNLLLYARRCILLGGAKKGFLEIIMAALLAEEGNSLGGMLLLDRINIESQKVLWQMELADMGEHPNICLSIPLLMDERRFILGKIKENYLLPLKTEEEVILKGQKQHRKIFNFVSQRILEEELDF